MQKGGSKTKRMISNVFKSKLTVILAIFILWIAGSQLQIGEAEEGATYASMAYQYYLLGEAGVEEDAEEETFAKFGSLGSGGVSGEFSYDDIVNSASENNKEEAQKFASIMATYSTFNYFSNKVQGFESIIPMIGRFASAIILLPLAIILDTLHLLVKGLLTAIASINIIPFLADRVLDIDGLEFTSVFAEELGISRQTLATLTSTLFTFAVAMIILTFAGMFKTGGQIDQQKYSKLKGRLFSILALPLVVGLGATLLENFHDLASSNNDINANFSRYMIDNRAWAYNFNFAPNGNDEEEGEISPSQENSYVDLDYNPYTDTGKERIEQINSESSLVDGIFPNSAMTLSYILSDSFTAVDFINYKGSEASQTFYGKDEGQSFGSYYDYAVTQSDQLIDVETSYYPSGGDRGNSDAAEGGYKEAIDDYAEDDKLKVSPQIAWRDRFIYGAKNAGENIDDYYAEPPSEEQMNNGVGNNKGAAFTNQSMFLILSTMFNETGGKYYIDAPARGILQAKASFDSNRSDYYVVSMVGSPWLTIFALIKTPLIQLLVLGTVVLAIVSVGILDMNLKPLMAWLKGSTLGDIEYSQAFIVYAVGIGGTIAAMIAIPPIITTAIGAIAELITIPKAWADQEASTPQASLALEGTPEIVSALLSIVLLLLFWYSPHFRNALVQLFTMPWAWAVATGTRLENQADGGSAARIAQTSKGMPGKDLNQALNFAKEATKNPTSTLGKVSNWAKKTGSGIKGDLNLPESPEMPSYFAAGQDGSVAVSEESAMLQQPGQIAKNGMVERAVNGLKETELNKGISNHVQIASIEAQEGIMQFHKEPTQENFVNAQNKLDTLERTMQQEGDYGTDQQNTMANAREELYNLSKSNNMDPGKPVSVVDKRDPSEKATDALKEIEMDRELPNEIQVASADAQKAIQAFQENPDQESFVEAQNKLNVLHSEIINDEYSEEREANVQQAKDNLNSLAEPHNLVTDFHAPDVVNQNAIFDRAAEGLKDYEIDRDLPNNVQVSAAESQNAMQQFREMPTEETYAEAHEKLNTLHSEVVEQGVEPEKEARVVQAKEELYNLSQAYNITEAAPIERVVGPGTTNESPVQNNYYEQNDTHYTTDNVENRYENRYETTHDTSYLNTENKYDHNVYKKEVQQLQSNLGSASNNPYMSQALRRLGSSRSSEDIVKGVNDVKQSLTHLKGEERAGIDEEKLSQSLERVLDFQNKKD